MEKKRFSFGNSIPLILLVLCLLLMQIANGAYAAQGLEPSGSFVILCYLSILGLIGYWLDKDSRNYGVKWVYDLGFFLYFAWPFIVPYYLFKTRGIRAILTILIFVGIYLATYLVGLLVFFAIVGMSS